MLRTDPDRFHNSSPRKRRGLINALGQVSNLLFGTATQAQTDAVHERLERLDVMAEKERVLLNVHSESLNVTTRNMHAVHNAVQRLGFAVNVSNAVVCQFSLKTLQIEGEQQLLHALLDLELALGQISNDVLNLKLRLQALLQTLVTPSMLSDDQLINILRAASIRPHGLLFYAVKKYLGLHRDLIRVTSRLTAVNGTRCFYLTFPLKGDPADTFVVFRIDSLSLRLPNSSYFAHHIPNAR